MTHDNNNNEKKKKSDFVEKQSDRRKWNRIKERKAVSNKKSAHKHKRKKKPTMNERNCNDIMAAAIHG